MADAVKILDDVAIDELADAARESDRKRHHLLWHESPDDLVHKISMWLEPDTYVRPHVHPHPDKWEILILLSGAVKLVLLDSSNDNDPAFVPRITRVVEMHADGTRMVQIPANQWHTLVALEPSLVFEVKQGPLIPPKPEDFASWSPVEGDTGCAAIIDYWCSAGVGEPAINL